MGLSHMVSVNIKQSSSRRGGIVSSGPAVLSHGADPHLLASPILCLPSSSLRPSGLPACAQRAEGVTQRILAFL